MVHRLALPSRWDGQPLTMEAPMTDELKDMETSAARSVISWLSDHRLMHGNIQSVNFQQSYDLTGLEGYTMKDYNKYRDHSFMIGPVDLPSKVTDLAAPVAGLITPSEPVTPNQKRRHHRARHGRNSCCSPENHGCAQRQMAG